MNPQKLLLLVLVLASAIGGLIYLNSQPVAEKVEVDPRAEQARALNQSAVARQQETIFQGSYDELEHIVLHRSIDYSMCKLKPNADGTWMMLEPFVDRAEPGLAVILVNLMFDTAALPRPEAWSNHKLEDLGLLEPRFDIEVLYRDGKEERLQIGARVPQSSNLFALLDGELIQVPSQLQELAGREPDHWRDHAMVLWPQTIRRVEWQPADGEGWVIAREGNRWNLIEPIQGAVDPLRVQSLMRLLGGRVSSMPSSRSQTAEAEKFKQSAGQLRLLQHPTDANTPTQQFWLNDNYVLDEGRGYFLSLASDDVRFLSLPLEKLRSKRLIAFEPNHITSMRLILDGEEHVLMRTRSGWKNDKGQDLQRAAANKLTTLLRYLSILETTELVRPDADVSVNSILLSNSRQPVVRGSVQLRYSVMADGRSAISTLQSRQSYAADRNLDEEWRQVLQFESQ